MEALASVIKDELVVAGIGSVASDWAVIAPRDANFCLSGPMGQAIPLGLGLALALPDRQVIVMEGDGGLVMNFGSLITVASQAPPNLKILIFNNAIYESSGGQRVPSADMDYARVAGAVGIPYCRRVEDVPSLLAAFREALETRCPCFIDLLLSFVPGETPAFGQLMPLEVKANFLRALGRR